MHMLVKLDVIHWKSFISQALPPCMYIFLSFEKPKVYETRCYVKNERCITIISSFFSGKPWTIFTSAWLNIFKENTEK